MYATNQANQDERVASKRAGGHKVSHKVSCTGHEIDTGSVDMLSTSPIETAAIHLKLLQNVHAAGTMEVTSERKQLHMTFTSAIERATGDQDGRWTDNATALSIKQPTLNHREDDTLNGKRKQEVDELYSAVGVSSQRQDETNVPRKLNSVRFAEDSKIGSEMPLENERLSACQARQDALGFQHKQTRHAFGLSSLDLIPSDETGGCQQEASNQTLGLADSGCNDENSDKVAKVTSKCQLTKLQEERIDGELDNRCQRHTHVEQGGLQAKGNDFDNWVKYEDARIERVIKNAKTDDQATRGLSCRHDVIEFRGNDRSDDRLEQFSRATNNAVLQKLLDSSKQLMTEETEEFQNDVKAFELRSNDSGASEEEAKYSPQIKRLKQRRQPVHNTRNGLQACFSTDKRVSDLQDKAFDGKLATRNNQDEIFKFKYRPCDLFDGDQDEQMRLGGDCDLNTYKDLELCDSTDFKARPNECAEPNPLPKRCYYDTVVQVHPCIDSEDANCQHSNPNGTSEMKHTCRAGRHRLLRGVDRNQLQAMADRDHDASDRANVTEIKHDKELEPQCEYQTIVSRKSRGSHDAARGWTLRITERTARALPESKDATPAQGFCSYCSCRRHHNVLHSHPSRHAVKSSLDQSNLDAGTAKVKRKLRSTKGTTQPLEGIVWPPGMEKECRARVGLDRHHPVAPPGLEHVVTDRDWTDYWTWLHWFSSWQLWYMKNGKESDRRLATEKQSREYKSSRTHSKTRRY